MVFNGIDISAHYDFPMEIYFCIAYTAQGTSDVVMPRYPFCNGWGKSDTDTCHVNQDCKEYTNLKLAWLSLAERKFFYCNEDLTSFCCEECAENFDKLVIGLATNGEIFLWCKNNDKSAILTQLKGKEIRMTLEEFLGFQSESSLEEYCRLRMEGIDHLSSPEAAFKTLMKRYNYRFKIDLDGYIEKDKTTTLSLKAMFFDGCYDRTNSEQLKLFGMKGVPRIISAIYRQKNNELLLTFFLDEDNLLSFSRFYGAHPETKTDFIIRIDAENKKYELALYRQGLKEPVVIPESAYQLIVFKNKFEDYRSENYNQPRGAWIW